MRGRFLIDHLPLIKALALGRADRPGFNARLGALGQVITNSPKFQSFHTIMEIKYLLRFFED